MKQDDEEITNIESLRMILIKEQSRAIDYEEAKNVGETLISFFEVLAGND